jgi:adenine/guanine phosphoribosyltransferase-like PRPP-binding protein
VSTPSREHSASTPLSATALALRNTIRRPGITCAVCTAPVRGFDRCWRCEQTRHLAGAADIVAPLIYTVTATPSAALLYDYKNHPARSVRDSCGERVKELVVQGVTRHERCLGRVAGIPVSHRLVIPSLTHRPGQHPFAELVDSVTSRDPAALTPRLDAWCDRAVNDKFAVQPAIRLDGRHVLILDDVWTTGSNAQSAALAVRRAGAAAVSVLVVGRWLSPRRRLSAEFLSLRLTRAYDPGICPVTGGQCPPSEL